MITYAIWQVCVLKQYQEFWEKLEKLKTHFLMLTLTVDAYFSIMVKMFFILGIKEFDYYTVAFGVSRALGCMSSGVWARALGLPIERPNSINIAYIEKLGSQ